MAARSAQPSATSPSSKIAQTESSNTGKNLAAHLPFELLVNIFRKTQELIQISRSHALKHDYVYSYGLFSSLTRVCRSWHAAARTVLYENIQISDAGQALLFYDTCRSSSILGLPGPLVRSVDLTILDEGSHSMRFLRRMLESMPTVSCISVYGHQCVAMRGTLAWQSITELKLHEDMERNDSFPDSDYFPPNLRSLTLCGETSIRTKDVWSDLHLPNLECLVLEDVIFAALDSDDNANPIEHNRGVPQLPKLRKLSLFDLSYRDPETEDALLEMIKEAGPSLVYLEIKGADSSTNLLRPSLFKNMNKLESFVYAGRDPLLKKKSAAKLFPQSLKRLDITWHGATSLGQSLIPLLSDPNYLPNLERCPRFTIVRQPDYPRTMPADDQVEQLLEIASAVSLEMKKTRPCLAADNQDLRLSGQPRWVYPIFPLPLAYMDCLCFKQRAWLERIGS